MTESDLIQLLTADLPQDDTVRVAAGDDCAVLQLGKETLLFKTDAVVEGVHFTVDTPAQSIGRKALARALSDIAAMGGTPTHALITLGTPAATDPDRLQSIYRGINNCAVEHGVNIVGGETTTLPCLTLSIALLGTALQPVLRTGSQIGDALFVTGELGGSISGHHLEFTPRLREGRWLADHCKPHAMIDLSDGLASDLRHLLGENPGAEILTSALPISRAARELARKNPSSKTPLLAALTDGEDYELLFTVSSKNAVPVLDAWKKAFPAVSLKCIGKITDQPGIVLRDEKGTQPFHLHGYDHLQQS